MNLEFITQDPAANRMLQMVDKVAPSAMPVLILGESGTGKELIAKRLHRGSARAQSPLVSMHCGALPESLLLGELFGTGAKRGLVELADTGTLFLDEIGEIGADVQAALLRFLQEGEVYRADGRAPVRADVRFIAATNRPVEDLVRQGRFREDLFYRINMLTLRIPPLRDRPDDITLLLQTFLGDGMHLAAAARQRLRRYPFPGNIRELQNMAARFKLLVEGSVIGVDDLPEEVLRATAGIAHPETAGDAIELAVVERDHILRTLARFEGNKTRAAHAMGITVKTLYNKLALYQRDAKQF